MSTAKPKPLPGRWVDVLMTVPEPVLYGVTIASELARHAEQDGTVRVNVGALQRFLVAHLNHEPKRTAGDVVFGLVEAGWLAVVDLDRMTFRLAVPAHLGMPLEPTEYVPADAVKRPVGRKRWMKPQKVKKR